MAKRETTAEKAKAAPKNAASVRKTAPRKKIVAKKTEPEALDSTDKAAKGAKAPAKAAAKKKLSDGAFNVGDFVVYPTHGVGRITDLERQEVAGTKLELFVISFEQDKMILRVPVGKAESSGMRVLSSRDTVRHALKTLKGRARVKRTMWSRRAQEYEAKINSGDLVAIAEVVRDLHRGEGQPEQSYSERQIYESALDRLAREVGAVEELDTEGALKRVEGALLKAAA
ncbi:MAG TPA: CarD family transcriptional regulator [Alphaproteobacteria bacterium]|jgi:CarD family transcriptional regulator|nr:CarD family transcriptional regulator [Alphaproteobacteria bacterium]HAM47744.1 CarD family transcriptional regulator [Alphaproteobacteria bacterium]HBA42233.1 CarD family transcriptional regulator [Alphaproteobacteria bacterium]HBC55300.1 CarD family transcriptional regulator [Alphaproteobacteria bacterium]HCO90872.1 CarD family transcriptional regulator [Alphaproteobacteria bacterium]